MKEAAEELKRSDSLRPDMPETLYALGKAAAISDPDVAEHALERVIELEKDTPLAGQAYLVLAQIHRGRARRSRRLVTWKTIARSRLSPLTLHHKQHLQVRLPHRNKEASRPMPQRAGNSTQARTARATARACPRSPAPA